MNEHPNNTTRQKVWLYCYLTAILYIFVFTWILDVSVADASAGRVPYMIVDTSQVSCYSNNAEIEFPKTGAAFFGQDAQYIGNEPAYKDNGDGTVTDLNTGLMWRNDPCQFVEGQYSGLCCVWKVIWLDAEQANRPVHADGRPRRRLATQRSQVR